MIENEIEKELNKIVKSCLLNHYIIEDVIIDDLVKSILYNQTIRILYNGGRITLKE